VLFIAGISIEHFWPLVYVRNTTVSGGRAYAKLWEKNWRCDLDVNTIYALQRAPGETRNRPENPAPVRALIRFFSLQDFL
jgi:hypothetical protein